MPLCYHGLMMELHTCLWNDVAALDFNANDLAPLATAFPDVKLVCHESIHQFLATAATATWLITWDFNAAWYPHCPSLQTIFTPAAGNDWVEPDPSGQVAIMHGTFHGQILSESLLGALLYMNHRMPDMVRNHHAREWHRNLQTDCRLLRNQTVVIIGLGHIGSTCAMAVKGLGARVIGIKRDPGRLHAPLSGVEVRGLDQLDRSLAEADHLVLLLPGDVSTDRFLTEERLRGCKRGVYIYNFGRGNALWSDDLIACADHIGGAFLDVVDEEPLPTDSPLWEMPHVMITPHSSCVYREYKSAFVTEMIERGLDREIVGGNHYS